MAWTELTDKRGRGSRVYQDSDNPRKHTLVAQTGTRWHYGARNEYTVDMTPVRDGDTWRITHNGWHYSLEPDGRVGFGIGGEREANHRFGSVGAGAGGVLAVPGVSRVDDATDGDITVAVDASELTGLAERSGLVWDVKRITAAGAVNNLATGDATIATAPTKAIT